MGIRTTLLHEGLKKRKRRKIKVPTKWACKEPPIVPLQTLLRLSVRLITTCICVKIAFCCLSVRLFTTCVKIAFCCLSVRLFTTCVKVAFCCLSVRLFTTCVKIAFYSLPVRLFTTCVKIAFYSLSPDSLRTMVLMRKDILYECVKTYVMRRKEDPYAFFTQSLRTRKFNFFMLCVA